MTMPPEVLVDPIGAVVDLITKTDPVVDVETVRQIGEQVGGGRAKRRRLATALAADPSVLTTGRSPASKAVGDLLLALRAVGASGISPPWCAECGREVTSMQRRGDDWYCSPCLVRPQVCAGCGIRRKPTFRDQHGQPRCSQCPDQDPRDPREVLLQVINSIDPDLETHVVGAAIEQVVTKAAHLQKLAWALEESPGLLTGDGAKAPFPMVLRLIDALCDAGATRIQRPACPRCRRVVTLSKQRDGSRICRNCFARARAVACSQCGRVCEPAARDADGRPLCPYCLISDPLNLENCIRCGRRQRVSTRKPDGPICGTCNPRQISTCSFYGRTTPCMTSKITGQPWCATCARSWAHCSGCGRLAQIRAGTRDEPLCATCAVPETEFWKTCPSCGTTGRLTVGACRRCHLHDQLNVLLADPATGHIGADLQTLRQALADVERPQTVLGWLRRSNVRALLTELAAGQRPLTHAALDDLPDSKTLRHLRSVLVATGALPIRDEHLAQLERWINQVVADRPDLKQKQLLHSYAVWHVLRRLRRRTRTAHTTHNQATVARGHIQAATAFLDWLAERDLTLATCSQSDLDGWIASASLAQRGPTGHFIRWAKRQKLTGLDFPATDGTAPPAPSTLKPDGNTPVGCCTLVLLYAQQPATISQLTLDHVHTSGDQVHLRLSREPVVLPEPLAALIQQLVAARRGHATIGDQGTSPWLLPGGRPGQPISPYRLAERLHQIGIHPGPARSTHCSNSPPNSPPPSSPACSASTSRSPSPGNRRHPETG
jgi:hypothetical protein